MRGNPPSDIRLSSHRSLRHSPAAERRSHSWLGLPCAVAIACIAAVLIGYPTLRLRDVYFALATLVYPLILGLVVTYFELQEVLVPTHPEAQFLYMSWVDPRWFAALFGAIALLVWLALTLVEASRYRLFWRRSGKTRRRRARPA